MDTKLQPGVQLYCPNGWGTQLPSKEIELEASFKENHVFGIKELGGCQSQQGLDQTEPNGQG